MKKKQTRMQMKIFRKMRRKGKKKKEKRTKYKKESDGQRRPEGREIGGKSGDTDNQ